MRLLTIHGHRVGDEDNGQLLAEVRLYRKNITTEQIKEMIVQGAKARGVCITSIQQSCGCSNELLM